jgi:hypothetical protein
VTLIFFFQENTAMTAIPSSVSHAGEHGAAYQAYRILQLGFVAAPILAGADKFFDKLVDWDKYLAAPLSGLTGGHAHAFMMVVGAIEIVAGIGVALKPRYFAYVVSAWLVGIIINLLMTGMYFDIALRDLGLALGAAALGRLAQLYDRGVAGGLMAAPK